MLEKAIALKYNKEINSAPTVVAKGKGALATKIIQKAKEYNVPIFSNPELASSLIDLELDHEVPEQLYHAVVDVFLWLMKNEAKAQQRSQT